MSPQVRKKNGTRERRRGLKCSYNTAIFKGALKMQRATGAYLRSVTSCCKAWLARTKDLGVMIPARNRSATSLPATAITRMLEARRVQARVLEKQDTWPRSESVDRKQWLHHPAAVADGSVSIRNVRRRQPAQGFEAKALDGANHTLSARQILCETGICIAELGFAPRTSG